MVYKQASSCLETTILRSPDTPFLSLFVLSYENRIVAIGQVLFWMFLSCGRQRCLPFLACVIYLSIYSDLISFLFAHWREMFA